MNVRIRNQEIISVEGTLEPGGIDDGWGGSKDLIISVGTQAQKAICLEGESREERRRRTTIAREEADSISRQ